MNGHHQQYSIIISRERTRALKYPAHQNLATCWEELTFHQRCRDSFDHRTGDCQLRRHGISSPADWTCKTETLVYFYLLHLDETINTYLLGKYEAPTVLALHKDWKQGEIASLAPHKDPCHPSPLNLQWNKEDARCYVEFTLQTCSSDFPTQKKTNNQNGSKSSAFARCLIAACELFKDAVWELPRVPWCLADTKKNIKPPKYLVMSGDASWCIVQELTPGLGRGGVLWRYLQESADKPAPTKTHRNIKKSLYIYLYLTISWVPNEMK